MPSPSPRGSVSKPPFAALLREHRERRRWSQAALAEQAEVSTRHLSFLENGKAAPSREMVLLLTSALELPLRDRNLLLGAAGFTPAYRESDLEGPELADVRRAIELLLAHHEPFPAMVYDPLWNLVRMNTGAGALLGGIVEPTPESASLLGNGLRFLFHPRAARPFVENWSEVASYALDQLRREVHAVPREGGLALLAEIEGYAGELAQRPLRVLETPLLEVRLRKGELALRFFPTVTTLGTPLDVTVQELRIESYFPADAATRAYMERARTA